MKKMSRKWQLTINNPEQSRDDIISLLDSVPNVIYYCLSDEVGLGENTPHTHIFIQSEKPVRFEHLKKKFPRAHIESCKGTPQQNRDYVFKLGKWLGDDKAGTSVAGTQYEWGELKEERQGKRTDMVKLLDMIEDGYTNYEIIKENPNYIDKLDYIERTRQLVREEQYKNVFRMLDVTYIFGSTGSGKTRGVMESYDSYEEVYRVTDYTHPFDGYKGQDVIVFEEFRSSLKIQDMLNYLDGYPLELPSRYNNKIACFTKVYIVTNIDLSEQYLSVQREHPETWKAFLRRIHKVRKYSYGGFEEYDLKALQGEFIWQVFPKQIELVK